jgi:hypothetical protein
VRSRIANDGWAGGEKNEGWSDRLGRECHEKNYIPDECRRDTVSHACQDRNQSPEKPASTVNSPSDNPTTAPPTANSPTDQWLGQWNGPEGTYLLLSKNRSKYMIKIQSLEAGVINHLLSSVSPGTLTQVLSGAGLAGLVGAGTRQLTPDQAQKLSPEAVQQLATHAQNLNPSVVESVSNFYAQHTTLVKTLGGAALTIALAKVAGRQPQA